ncbi:hypothetical protein [Streptomyces sp. NPDC054784]
MTSWFKRSKGPDRRAEEKKDTNNLADPISSVRNDIAQSHYEQDNLPEAMAIWREMAEDGNNDATAGMVLALCCDGQYTEALLWWWRLKSLRAGLRAHGPGTQLRSEGRTEAAEGWWRMAARELQDDRCCEYLGIALRERGLDVEADEWLRQGAERGHGACARELAVLSFERAEKATDQAAHESHAAEAFTWMRAAAVAGDARARLILQQLEEDGHGADSWTEVDEAQRETPDPVVQAELEDQADDALVDDAVAEREALPEPVTAGADTEAAAESASASEEAEEPEAAPEPVKPHLRLAAKPRLEEHDEIEGAA